MLCRLSRVGYCCYVEYLLFPTPDQFFYPSLPCSLSKRLTQMNFISSLLFPSGFCLGFDKGEFLYAISVKRRMISYFLVPSLWSQPWAACCVFQISLGSDYNRWRITVLIRHTTLPSLTLNRDWQRRSETLRSWMVLGMNKAEKCLFLNFPMTLLMGGACSRLFSVRGN